MKFPFATWPPRGALVFATALAAVGPVATPIFDSSVLGAADPQCATPATEKLAPPNVRSDRPAIDAVTYNIHSGLGATFSFGAGPGEIAAHLRQIAESIAGAAPHGAPPHIVGLNEVDFNSRRSGWLDEATFLAAEIERLTGYTYRVIKGETWRRGVPGLELQFGNAVLVRGIVKETRNCLLDADACTKTALPKVTQVGIAGRALREPRAALAVTVELQGELIDIVLTHLDAIAVPLRESQAAHILRNVVRDDRPTILMGDMNAVPTAITARRAYAESDRTHDILTGGRLFDVRAAAATQASTRPDWGHWATYPSTAPRWPLDAAFVSHDFWPQEVRVLQSNASDHYGFYMRLSLADNDDHQAIALWHDSQRKQNLTRLLQCDFSKPSGDTRARANWLMVGTSYVDVAAPEQRRTLEDILDRK